MYICKTESNYKSKKNRTSSTSLRTIKTNDATKQICVVKALSYAMVLTQNIPNASKGPLHSFLIARRLVLRILFINNKWTLSYICTTNSVCVAPPAPPRQSRSASLAPPVQLRQSRSASPSPQIPFRKFRSANLSPTAPLSQLRSASSTPPVSLRQPRSQVSLRQSRSASLALPEWRSETGGAIFWRT